LGAGPLLHPPRSSRPAKAHVSILAVEWDALNTACLSIIFSLN
jgi:hypothetical protein